jgi:hypothetical protein
MRLLGFWGVLLSAAIILLLPVLFLVKLAPSQSAAAAASDG